jgi:lipoate-protein ligase B
MKFSALFSTHFIIETLSNMVKKNSRLIKDLCIWILKPKQKVCKIGAPEARRSL